jgi:thiol-disulfide isomerase/thioredoxin
MLLGVFAVPGCKSGAGGVSSQASASAEHDLVGEPAPPFELSALSGGESLNSSALSGQVVLLDFWATWCAPCRESFPIYQKLQSHYGDKIRVVAVSQDEDQSEVGPFVEELGVKFFVGWDDSQALGKSYHLEAMPTLFVLDQNGLVRHVHEGFHDGDESALRQVIDSLL